MGLVSSRSPRSLGCPGAPNITRPFRILGPFDMKNDIRDVGSTANLAVFLFILDTPGTPGTPGIRGTRRTRGTRAPCSSPYRL